MTAVEDAVCTAPLAYGRHRRRKVVEQVRVQVPAPVEVGGRVDLLAPDVSALVLHAALAVAAQLEQEEVGAEVEHRLDELARVPGAAVLRVAVHQQQRHAEQGLREGLGARAVARDDEVPAGLGLDGDLFQRVEIAELHLGEAGHRQAHDARHGRLFDLSLGLRQLDPPLLSDRGMPSGPMVTAPIRAFNARVSARARAARTR